MNIYLILLLVLLLYSVFWFVINLVLYFLSIALKKPVILQSFHGISMLFLWLYNTLIGIGLLWFGVRLFLDREFLWLFVYLIFGYGLVGWVLNILTMPFLFIQVYFASKLENFNFDEDITRAEVLDENNKIVDITEGDSTISIRFAKYFIGFYLANLLSMLIFPDDSRVYQWGDYLLTPFLQIIGGTIILGIPYMIYHKIRYKSFIQKDKRYFLIGVWKMWLVIFALYALLALLLRLFAY